MCHPCWMREVSKPQKLHSRPGMAIGRSTKSVPPVSVILVRLYFRTLPKCKADKSGKRAEGKQRQQPVRHIRIRCSGPHQLAATFVSGQASVWIAKILDAQIVGLQHQTRIFSERPLLIRFGHWVAATRVDWRPFFTRRPVAKC